MDRVRDIDTIFYLDFALRCAALCYFQSILQPEVCSNSLRTSSREKQSPHDQETGSSGQGDGSWSGSAESCRCSVSRVSAC